MIKTRLIRLLSHAKKYVIYQIIWKYITLICQIVTIYGLAGIMTAIAESDSEWTDIIMTYLIPVLAALVIRFISDKKSEKMSFHASVDVKRILRGNIYGKLLKLGASYREHISTAELVQLSTEGVEQLETYFGRYLAQFFYSLTSPVILFIFLCRYNMTGSIVLLIGVPLLPLSIVVVQKIAKKLLSKYWGAYASLGDSFLENLQGLTTLKIYKSDGLKAEAMDKESEHFRRITMKVLQMQLNSIIVMDIVAYGGAAAGMVISVIQYVNGSIDVSGALLTILLAVEFFLPLRILGSYFHVAMNGMAASDKIFAFLDIPEKEDKEEISAEPECDCYAGREMDIKFNNVSFAYNNDRQILKNVTIDMPSGSFTAIAGESGCGKSTLAGLIMGRNTGYSGDIILGNRELECISHEEICKRITYISHDSYMFRGTVRSNLLMGRADAGDEELAEALKRVNMYDYVEKHPDGLDMDIAERGSNLSGGQRQRLALARALLHDSDVYIFDEATSNIDVESEALILSVIHELAKTKTIIMISHRLANVVNADRIFMIKDGIISEEGTHEELMNNGGDYSRLYMAQYELENYGRDSKAQDVPVTVINNSAGNKSTDNKCTHYSDGSKRRSGISIMLRLIILVKPLIPYMLLAVLLGSLGYLCAISLTVMTSHAVYNSISGGGFLTAVIVIAIMRGILHYAEQYCNHYIAFRLLAVIRHKIFDRLRKLAPARLDGRDRGNLISIITSDTELLEVFYAHTISPIAIAVIVSIIMTIFIGNIDIIAGAIALAGYVTVGVIIPLTVGKLGADSGMMLRDEFGRLGSYVLDSLYGIDETLQYGNGNARKDRLDKKSRELGIRQMKLNILGSWQGAVTGAVILLYSIIMLIYMTLRTGGTADVHSIWIATVAMMGSFGPVSALSALANNLNQTLACGERVLSLLEEKPVVCEVEAATGDSVIEDRMNNNVYGMELKTEDVCFSYPQSSGDGEENILSDCSFAAEGGVITGILGASGCGKSTLLKLMMRFYDADSGRVSIAGEDVKNISTSLLRDTESYVTQETVIFHDTIRENIRMAKPDATEADIITAAKKAAIHDFIMSLPEGYDTVVGEQGSTLSGGERQRIGVARAFLHNAPCILLDEPTSNLDSLNEGIILKSLRESCNDKTVIIVSHRRSSLNVADRLVMFAEG